MTAAGILLVSPVAYAVVRDRQRKQAGERTVDEVFADDAWQAEPLTDGEETATAASGFEPAALNDTIDSLCDRLFHGDDIMAEPNLITPVVLPTLEADSLESDGEVATLAAPRLKCLTSNRKTSSEQRKSAPCSSQMAWIWTGITCLLLATCGFMACREVLFAPSAPTHRRIDQMELGDRTTGRNPLREEVTTTPEPTPENSRAVHLELMKPSGKLVRMRLIWTLDEIELLGARPGATVYLEMPEMGVEGDAIVTRITTWKPKPGNGNLVTGVFVHEPDDGLLNVHIEGLDEPIGCTPEHLFWSNDKGEFVPARDLHSSEKVWTREAGLVSVSAIQKRDCHEAVYNLTVHNEHVYDVAIFGVLVHNSCLTTANARALRKNLGDAISAGEEAHHIVASTHSHAQHARNILKRYRIDINDAVNGVGLETRLHRGQGLHSYRGIDEVTSRLKKAVADGDTYAQQKQNIKDALQDMADLMRRGKFLE